ncbi:MAG TPA: GDSL-type esterase/lipase family protein [Armatimonadota bacterium]|nr:GDSL-type esterase/lipase family protein [Armatimonadota bacterium]
MQSQQSATQRKISLTGSAIVLLLGFLCILGKPIFASPVIKGLGIRPQEASIVVSPGECQINGATVRLNKESILTVDPVENVTVKDEAIKLSPDKPASYNKGTRLWHMNSARLAFNAQSLVIRRSIGGEALVEGKDYLVSPEFGMVGIGPESTVTTNETVYASYTYSLMRIDAVDITAKGEVIVWRGIPHVSKPQPPALVDGCFRLANIFRPYRATIVSQDDIYPMLETAADAKTATTPGRIPKILAKLHAKQPVTIVCWGDSVTAGGDASSPATQYVSVFAEGLRQRFPGVPIQVINISVGGSNSGQWLYPEKNPPFPGQKGIDFQRIVDAHPDLVTVEFVNDSWLSSDSVNKNYSEMLQRFSAMQAETIFITPHFMDFPLMGFHAMRDTENRRYVFTLRQFAEAHCIALADASARWEHLWKEGIPYMTLIANTINHPDDRGHRIFAEELWKCFGEE